LAARFGLVVQFLFSAKLICMGNRSNRLTAIQKKNQTSQIFPTWPFPPRASCPAYPGATLELPWSHPGARRTRARPAAASRARGQGGAYPVATYPGAGGRRAGTPRSEGCLSGWDRIPLPLSVFDFSIFSDFSIFQPLPPARIAHHGVDNIYRAPTLQPNGEEDSPPRTCPAPALTGGHTCPGADEGKDGLPWTYPGPTL